MKIENKKSDLKMELMSSNTNNNFLYVNKGMIILTSELSGNHGTIYQQILINEKITDQKIFSMKIHIHATVAGEIIIGVVDRKQQNNKISSYRSGYAICYSGNPGSIFQGQGECNRYKKE